MKPLLALALLCCSTNAFATAPGLFTGDDWRYRRETLLPDLPKRILADFISIPSGVSAWDVGDWVSLTSVIASTAMLSLGTPSLDQRFQDYLENQVLKPGHFTVWNTAGDIIIWSSVGVACFGLLIGGILSHDAVATETATLMLEAFTVAQVYHQILKLLLGRADPLRPELQGQYYGPAKSFQLWPSGTPSGHMASMYALLSVLMTYFDHPALWVGLNAAALIFGATLVADNYHWASDVLLGGALGFFVGRWVVHHRSTRFFEGDHRVPVRVNVVPLFVPTAQAAGFALCGTF